MGNLPVKPDQVGEVAIAERKQRSMGFMPSSWNEAWSMAQVFARSTFVSKEYRNKPENVMLAIATGRGLGLLPHAALSQIAVFDGKVIMSALLIQTRAMRHALCNYFRMVHTDDTRAVYETLREGDPEPTRLEWTIEQATKAKLVGKDIWKKYPAEMLRSRCVTALVRICYPDAIVGIYSPEEIEEPIAVGEPDDGEGVIDLDFSVKQGQAQAEPEAAEGSTNQLGRFIEECETLPALLSLLDTLKALPEGDEKNELRALYGAKKAELIANGEDRRPPAVFTVEQEAREEFKKLKAVAGPDNDFHRAAFLALGLRLSAMISKLRVGESVPGIEADHTRALDALSALWAEVNAAGFPPAWETDKGEAKTIPIPTGKDIAPAVEPVKQAPTAPISAAEVQECAEREAEDKAEREAIQNEPPAGSSSGS